MARKTSPNSVSSIISVMEVSQEISLPNPYYSVAVMVSNLKKKEEHKEKLFKIRSINDVTTVIRLK